VFAVVIRRAMHGDARVRIGVCSDVHGRHDRLLAVLAAMAAAGVDERWCLGDLVGREPVTAELVGAASQLDLLIAGNHDAWALGPDRVVARGRDVFRLSSRALASRHGIDCWHGSPRHPLLGFLTEASAARILPGRPLGSLGLVGHTHEPALFVYDGAATRAVRPDRAGPGLRRSCSIAGSLLLARAEGPLRLRSRLSRNRLTSTTTVLYS
jgi:predicted phosphodiesterase